MGGGLRSKRRNIDSQRATALKQRKADRSAKANALAAPLTSAAARQTHGGRGGVPVPCLPHSGAQGCTARCTASRVHRRGGGMRCAMLRPARLPVVNGSILKRRQHSADRTHPTPVPPAMDLSGLLAAQPARLSILSAANRGRGGRAVQTPTLTQPPPPPLQPRSATHCTSPRCALFWCVVCSFLCCLPRCAGTDGPLARLQPWRDPRRCLSHSHCSSSTRIWPPPYNARGTLITTPTVIWRSREHGVDRRRRSAWERAPSRVVGRLLSLRAQHSTAAITAALDSCRRPAEALQRSGRLRLSRCRTIQPLRCPSPPPQHRPAQLPLR